MTELAASLRGRAEALRNIARKRRRRGRSLPELDPVRAALTHLREVADGPGGAPSAGAAETAAGALSTALRELRQDLEQLANRRDRAIAAALDTFRRGAIGG